MHQRLLPFCFLLLTLTASAQTVTDIDGNVYNTVTINGREWMAENLATSHYQDGTPIPLVSNPTTWFNMIVSGARCFYWNDSALIAPDYGTLYNWNAVTNPLNICPTGWHVPTDAEWNAMTMFLDPTVDPDYQGFTGGTGTDIGNQLKEAGGTYWDAVDNGGTNSSGFGARGGGDRESDGDFEHLNSYGYFWTSTYGEQGKAFCRVLYHGGPTIFRFILDRLYGASVRCIADIPTAVPEGRLDEGLQLYPNPATTTVQLAGLPAGPVAVVIADAAGRTVRTQQLGATARSVSVAGLPPGIYLLSARTGAGEKQARLLVE